MSQMAFIFPGQGSQYVGMVKDFYQARTLKLGICFHLAEETTGLFLKAPYFSRPHEPDHQGDGESAAGRAAQEKRRAFNIRSFSGPESPPGRGAATAWGKRAPRAPPGCCSAADTLTAVRERDPDAAGSPESSRRHGGGHRPDVGETDGPGPTP